MTRAHLGLATALLFAALPCAARGQDRADWVRADSAVRRLPPDSFPDLPTEIRRDLSGRGCRIPQSYLGDARQNVVHANLMSRASNDWAVLCSIGGVSRVLVYAGAGSTQAPDSIAIAPDINYLQLGVPGHPTQIGYSRHLELAPVRRVARRLPDISGASGAVADHSGLEDVFLDKASEVWFYWRGRWRSTAGSN